MSGEVNFLSKVRIPIVSHKAAIKKIYACYKPKNESDTAIKHFLEHYFSTEIPNEE